MIKNLRENTHSLRMLQEKKIYRLMDFQPFNQRNYRIWQKADDLYERVKLLETILVGNILNLATNLDWKIPDRLEVSVLNIRDTKMVKTHGTQRMAFNLVYKANIDLPPGIGLGRAVSHGFGVSMPCKNQE